MKSTSPVCCATSVRSPSSAQQLRGVSCVRGEGRVSKPTSAVGTATVNPRINLATVAEPEMEVEMLACLARLEQLVPTVSQYQSSSSSSSEVKQLSQVQLLQHVIDYILDLESTLDCRPDDAYDNNVSVSAATTGPLPSYHRCSRASSYDEGTISSDDDTDAAGHRLHAPMVSARCSDSQRTASQLPSGDQQTPKSDNLIQSW